MPVVFGLPGNLTFDIDLQPPAQIQKTDKRIGELFFEILAIPVPMGLHGFGQFGDN
jgi:hypothetical protein